MACHLFRAQWVFSRVQDHDNRTFGVVGLEGIGIGLHSRTIAYELSRNLRGSRTEKQAQCGERLGFKRRGEPGQRRPTSKLV